MIYNLLIKISFFFQKYFLPTLALYTLSDYLCTTLNKQRNTRNAEVAQLVERNLAKVEVASSNLVFCSEIASTGNGAFSHKNLQTCLKVGKCQGGGTGRHAGLKIL
jgi:hypothetical protein